MNIYLDMGITLIVIAVCALAIVSVNNEASKMLSMIACISRKPLA